MRWMIADPVAAGAPAGLAWLKAYLGRFDLSRVDWVRVDLGRGRYSGAYGRCWYPEGRKKGFRLSLQVPGPFPCRMVVRKPPIYYAEAMGPHPDRRIDGQGPSGGLLWASRDLLPGEEIGEYHEDHKDGVVKRWHRVRAHTPIASMDEAVVWVGAHEAFHFLRRSGQIPGRQGEIEADAHADAMLASYRLTL